MKSIKIIIKQLAFFIFVFGCLPGNCPPPSKASHRTQSDNLFRRTESFRNPSQNHPSSFLAPQSPHFAPPPQSPFAVHSTPQSKVKYNEELVYLANKFMQQIDVHHEPIMINMFKKNLMNTLLILYEISLDRATKQKYTLHIYPTDPPYFESLIQYMITNQGQNILFIGYQILINKIFPEDRIEEEHFRSLEDKSTPLKHQLSYLYDHSHSQEYKLLILFSLLKFIQIHYLTFHEIHKSMAQLSQESCIISTLLSKKYASLSHFNRLERILQSHEAQHLFKILASPFSNLEQTFIDPETLLMIDKTFGNLTKLQAYLNKHYSVLENGRLKEKTLEHLESPERIAQDTIFKLSHMESKLYHNLNSIFLSTACLALIQYGKWQLEMRDKHKIIISSKTEKITISIGALIITLNTFKAIYEVPAFETNPWIGYIAHNFTQMCYIILAFIGYQTYMRKYS